jgi:uncharacterized protein (TIGR03067 family)
MGNIKGWLLNSCDRKLTYPGAYPWNPMDQFDAYYKWLGIPPQEQPPNHYRLLGLTLFESDPDVIDAAANRLMAYLQQCATGPRVAESQRILNEVAAARVCLLNAKKRRSYDQRLRKSSAQPSAVTAPDAVAEKMPWEEPADEQPPSEKSPPDQRGPINRAATAAELFAKMPWKLVSIAMALLTGLVMAVVLMQSGEEPMTIDDDSPVVADSAQVRNTENREVVRDDLKPTISTDTGGPRENSVAIAPQPVPAKLDNTAAQKLSQEIIRSDTDRLQGRWECVFEEAAGVESTTTELASMKKVLTVNGTQMTLQRVSNGITGEYRGTFSLGWDGERRLFDFTGTDPDGKPVEWLGIYEFSGDVFKVCYRIRSDNDLNRQRADVFGTTKFSETIFNKFRRTTVPSDVVKDVAKTEPRPEPTKPPEPPKPTTSLNSPPVTTTKPAKSDIAPPKTIAKATPAVSAPPSAPKLKVSEAPQWKPLVSSLDDLDRHWTKGDDRGKFNYDPVRKILSVNSPHDLGTIAYRGAWTALMFELRASQISDDNFDLEVNGNTLRLGKTVLRGNQWIEVRIAHDAAARRVDAFVNGRGIDSATVSKTFATALECKLSSSGGQIAILDLRNLQVLPVTAAALPTMTKTASPNSKPPESKKPATTKKGATAAKAAEWITLADDFDELDRFWTHGDSRGNFKYDAKTKIISINSPHELGTITYPNAWSTLSFDISASQLSSEGFTVEFDGSLLRLGRTVLTNGRWVTVRIVHIKSSNRIDAFVDDRVVSSVGWPATHSNRLECKLASYGGDYAVVNLKNLRVRTGTPTKPN